MKRRKKVSLIILSTVMILVLASSLFIWLAPQFGSSPKGDRLVRIKQSPNYRDNVFQNSVPTSVAPSPGDLLSMAAAYFKKRAGRPSATLPTRTLDRKIIGKNGASVAVSWLGHSTAIIEIGGKVILTDPALSRSISPVPFVGPKAFAYSNPITAADLPEVDAMIISHDHYDHLDYLTIRALKSRIPIIFTALGVGAHLERWGVAKEKIVELDWWQQIQLGDVTIVATPVRHFSGRTPNDRFKTLFASWVILGPNERVFFGADSGYFDGFKRIGEKYGPFDITMLECGAYSRFWPDLHMTPEETARAHQDLHGEILMPIHWAKFDLSLHAWNEPIERLLKAAMSLNITVTTPMVGERFIPSKTIPRNTWWSGIN